MRKKTVFFFRKQFQCMLASNAKMNLATTHLTQTDFYLALWLTEGTIYSGYGLWSTFLQMYALHGFVWYTVTHMNGTQ